MSVQSEDKVESIVVKIISSLNDQERILLLPRIIRKLQRYLEMYGNQGEIISAIPLEKEFIEKIEQSLEERLKEKVILNNKIDKKIIGGFIIKFRDIIIDQSLKRQLTEIKQKAYET
ncbi:MAG: ATP synthase subunit delta [Microgenomates group bacterium GW2011_GWC1_41_8]|uniref:ATP synthase subunit delta n=2 Tax=Candidatus Roizmaniibacteriota TaxID=1752723 RepID=A0A0G0T3N9_9BACT|nr:MAG: ATP synthase subunit delta [Candidatus Levybacteria bacterium GW2011_GWA2_40_16]KKR71668.1 MAG: ATP synthase subunit delta [Candidatus Roizmanbacteria bacterium GW2011_GWB1_40_7]KKR93994.1 MAG: ATP synthase subunit delta [Candidatus Roizmanbacteria bacterium GW2011_GWA1_41_13]KKS23299.1 MAG: ATP synthase subunit delta [Microgenomates group bacterium GW2011_GWC1_41_8]OGK48463.1 MAG: ATP synthase F1 subunit delta [Candidatus Roizmanbacteria bacterium RIFCSPLOWO2_01_FULL_40_14]